MRSTYLLPSSGLALMISLLVTGTVYAKANADDCNNALRVTTNQNMNFGDYIPVSPGTIILDPLTGTLVETGVVLAAGTVSRLIFSFSFQLPNPLPRKLRNLVKDCSKKKITITLPPEITITNAGVNVTINNIKTNIFPDNKFKIKDEPNITVGGTLNSGGSEPGGTYTGTELFDFTF